MKDKTKKQRREENARYRDNKLKQGWKVFTYLIPITLAEEIRAYKDARLRMIVKNYNVNMS